MIGRSKWLKVVYVPYFSHLANHDELVPLLVVPELAVPRLVVPPVGGISSTILLSDTHE